LPITATRHFYVLKKNLISALDIRKNCNFEFVSLRIHKIWNFE